MSNQEEREQAPINDLVENELSKQGVQLGSVILTGDVIKLIIKEFNSLASEYNHLIDQATEIQATISRVGSELTKFNKIFEQIVENALYNKEESAGDSNNE